ncbi:ABC transporter [Fragilaria crotonensis]|nr:ABC transporter [Fragilaria crotonensis]
MPNTLPLVSLRQARLRYRSAGIAHQSRLTPPITMDILHPKQGGHVVLGRNGSGKTLLSCLLSPNPGDFLYEGSYTAIDETISRHADYAIAHVSFQSHEQLLRQQKTDPDNPDSTSLSTAWQVISGGGNLSKAAQFLVVRFGLFPLLHRNVSTLSTGEIRKVLLVKALSKRPKLLVLDNAFDGLDVPSRNALRDLVSKTLRGFRQDILVQAVDSKATAHTQVVLLTHRAEEIVDECQHVTYMTAPITTPTTSTNCNPAITGVDENVDDNSRILTEARNGQSGEQLLCKAMGASESTFQLDWGDDPTLPTTKDISNWWAAGRSITTTNHAAVHQPKQDPIVQTNHLRICQGNTTLLHDLTWTISAGEHWLVAGGNGAGKSTLSRCLALQGSSVSVPSMLRMAISSDDIGWVSTELHMATSQSNRSVRDVVTHDGKVPMDSAMFVVTQALAMTEVVDNNSDQQLWDRPFSTLSQGEQKLILIASAMALRPALLVLDEPCQGLDALNRRRVLGFVERMCQATSITLVYITHHLEEVIPSITHVLHLVGGKAVYTGSRSNYDPAEF